jgi:hypothetical protein
MLSASPSGPKPGAADAPAAAKPKVADFKVKSRKDASTFGGGVGGRRGGTLAGSRIR